MRRYVPLSSILLMGICLNVGGCAGFATVASDVAGTAVDKTYQLARTGKAESFQPVPIDEAIAAARTAASDLSLSTLREQPHPDQLKLVYKDQRKQEIVITLVRRSPTVTEIHVDVGLFGVEGMSQLTLRQILHHLAISSTTQPGEPSPPAGRSVSH